MNATKWILTAAALLLVSAAAAGADPVIDGAYPGRLLPDVDGLNIFFDQTVAWFSDPPKWDEYAAGAAATADTFLAYAMLGGATAPAMTALEFRLRVDADPAPVLRTLSTAALPASGGEGNIVNLEAVYATPVPLTDDPQLLLAVEVAFAEAPLREIAWYLEPSTNSSTGAPAYRDEGMQWREMHTLPGDWTEPVIVLNRPYVDADGATWGRVKSLFY